MMYYNENTKVLQSEAPWGDKYYSEKAKEKYFSEWQQVDDDFIPPVSDEKKALVDKKETEKAFKEAKEELMRQMALAQLQNDQDLIKDLQDSYAELISSIDTENEEGQIDAYIFSPEALPSVRASPDTDARSDPLCL